MILSDMCEDIDNIPILSLHSDFSDRIGIQLNRDPFDGVSDSTVKEIRNYINNIPLDELSFTKLIKLTEITLTRNTDTDLLSYDA